MKNNVQILEIGIFWSIQLCLSWTL